ncbi:Aste57867_20748 [Aphanomyces stellatus]|uniref:Aste57867_20748 protein n=1 Tax=Aphanomyces stellatus TaxID=120398 RepID=A0A485LGB8_9STRA|nr:hypothetical protein As57867_020680 [Aphanomyces stellatus]VFT97427.1 Aste57867_20748 [Aphanomyces stellatus]
MGHQSYVRPDTDDEVGQRPVRRKGSDQAAADERTPLAAPDRKKEQSVFWRQATRSGKLLLTLTGILACAVLLVMWWGSRLKSSSLQLELGHATRPPLPVDEATTTDNERRIHDTTNEPIDVPAPMAQASVDDPAAVAPLAVEPVVPTTANEPTTNEPTTREPTTTRPLTTSTTTTVAPPATTAVPTTTLPPPTTTTAPIPPVSTLASIPPRAGVDLTSALAYQTGLTLWLQADKGLEFTKPCPPESAHCTVREYDLDLLLDLILATRWKNSAAGDGMIAAFVPANPADPRDFPLYVPRVQNNRPILHLSCPLVATSSAASLVHDQTTLFFVVSPASLDDDDGHNTFFGHASAGQFRFHARHASFVGAAPFDEVRDVAASPTRGTHAAGAFSVLTYRLDKSVAIQVNGRGFEISPSNTIVQASEAAKAILGNAHADCDAHAFHGRMAELLVYDAVLADAAIEVVEGYLHRKWAIPRATAAAAATTPPPHEQQPPPADGRTTLKPDGLMQATDPPPTTPPPPPPPHMRGSQVFDPNDVFKWSPPADADAAQVAVWKKTVAEKIQQVERFQYGGAVLHDFINSLKDELNALRDNMFG